jgi:hypothetical protein
MGLMLGRVAQTVVLSLVIASPAFAKDDARARALAAGAKRKVAIEAAQEHIKLGLWCRDAGLIQQATAEFLRGEEVADGHLPGAAHLVAVMREMGDKFWTTIQRRPRALLDTYEKKAWKVELDHQKAWMRVARDEYKADLVEDAYSDYCAVVAMTDAPLSFNAKGEVQIEAGTVPVELSERMKAEAVTVGGGLYVRDPFLKHAPSVKELFEADGPRIRVRCEESEAVAKDLHAVATALFPFLEEDTGGRPKRKMTLFVFKERSTYASWCDKAGRGDMSPAAGFADGETFTALVCAEGMSGDGLRGMCMHELAHLFQFGVTPAVMPSWYSEGFAETWGGSGTFTWEGGKLSTGGMMSDHRLAAVRTDEGYIPLADLLAGDALKMLTKDRSLGGRFYAQSWAFLRYMRTAAPSDLIARFRTWDNACKGGALGAKAGRPREEDTAPASATFQKMLGNDVPALERGFRAWLEKLGK